MPENYYAKQMADRNYEKAKQFVFNMNEADVDMVQKRLRINYPAAELIMKRLESEGFIGPELINKPRAVYKTPGDSK